MSSGAGAAGSGCPRRIRGRAGTPAGGRESNPAPVLCGAGRLRSDTMTGFVKLGIRPCDAGDVIASLLRVSPRPLTSILEDQSGLRLTLQVLDDGIRPLTPPERDRLDAAGIRQCRWRRGLLTAGATVAASV